MELTLPQKTILGLILLGLITTYITLIFNSCIKTNWTHSHTPIIVNEMPLIHHYSATSVRVVSLLYENEPSDISSKYKYIKEQNFRPERQLPDALIIGVKKGGTRALLEFIRLHPHVRAAGNEIHFFDKNYHRGFEWYRNHMPATLEGQLTIEKTPSYFITREAPRRVYLMNPSTKLMVVLRDPVTRAISDYTQAISKKTEMKRFEDLTFINGTSQSAIIDTSWGPIKLGLYYRYLARWLTFFPLSQIHFVSGERLIIDPAIELKRVQEFLGIKILVGEKHFYYNSTKGFPCLFKSERYSMPHCLGKTKGRSHPYINPIVLERLRHFYRPFNERLYQMTGINFGWL